MKKVASKNVRKLLQSPKSNVYSVRIYVIDNSDGVSTEKHSELIVLASDVEECVRTVRAANGKNSKYVTTEIVECRLISTSTRLLTMV